MESFSSLYGLPYAAVRDGRPAPVTCARCGCRLTPDPAIPGRWIHFAGSNGRDARGCTVDCVGLPHDRHGNVVNAG